MGKKNKRLYIDMCAGSELMDTQGETLSIEGADISELKRLNDNHGKGFFNSLGIVTESKKIFKKEDCENERHEHYWNKIKAPYIYAKGYLHNNEDHPNAKAAAAIIRNIHREDCPLKVKASVEGGVIARGIKDTGRLARTKIHSVAITMTPANNATLVEPLSLDKSNTDWEADKQLIKSVMHLAETNIPSFRHIERHASANTIHDNILKIQELAKSLGIDIEVKESTPEKIMKNAVFHKVADNISKINELVKAINENGKSFSANKQARQLNRQQNFQNKISGITAESNRSKIRDPRQEIKPVGTGTINRANPMTQPNDLILRQHAKKASENPIHLKNIYSQIKSTHGHEKAKAVVDKIRTHMEKADDMEKGDIARTAKNLVILGALTTGAQLSTPKKEVPKQQTKQEQAKELEEKRIAHNKKVEDPGMKIGPIKGYNQMEPNAKLKYYERRKKLKDGLKKALTAGYGGAGAPGAMTGGSVIQSESLDDGRTKKSDITTDGFSYISCNDCGHEQVYMKHQVKCRKCKKNFSLNKLQNHI